MKPRVSCRLLPTLVWSYHQPIQPFFDRVQQPPICKTSQTGNLRKWAHKFYDRSTKNTSEPCYPPPCYARRYWTFLQRQMDFFGNVERLGLLARFKQSRLRMTLYVHRLMNCYFSCFLSWLRRRRMEEVLRFCWSTICWHFIHTIP